MRVVIILFLVFIHIGCEKSEKPVIIGVWQMKDIKNPVAHYYEVVITDSLYMVFTENGISYIADYKLNNNILVQYVKGIDNSEISHIDTLQFQYDLSKDSLELYNTHNRENGTSWSRLHGVNTYSFTDLGDFEKYAENFKCRYAKSILQDKSDSIRRINLDNFDLNWAYKN